MISNAMHAHVCTHACIIMLDVYMYMCIYQYSGPLNFEYLITQIIIRTW